MFDRRCLMFDFNFVRPFPFEHQTSNIKHSEGR
jgi:hypothetical protein